jgi:von Willebrand factor type A domain
MLLYWLVNASRRFVLTDFPKTPRLPPLSFKTGVRPQPDFHLNQSFPNCATDCIGARIAGDKRSLAIAPLAIAPLTIAAETVMSDSQSATNFQNAGGPPVKRGFAAVPSWMLSLVLHGALIVVLTTVLAGRTGGIVGDPKGDFRRIGIYVGHSGGDGKGDGAGDDKTGGVEQRAPPQKPADTTPPAPAVKPEKPTPAATAETKEPSTPASKPQPVIGPAAVADAETRAPTPPQKEALRANGDQTSSSPATSTGKWDGLVFETRGGGSGRGNGRGSYGNAPFFGIWDAGARFIYVIDCSGSMYSYHAMDAAKNELLSSLANLRRSQQFQIVFYNLDQQWMKAPGKSDFQYFPANESYRRLAAQFVAAVQPDGGTQHVPALELALRLHPDVIFFLTDAGEPAMKPEEMEEIQKLNAGRTRIHCVQFGMHDDAAADFLRKLAAQNNGDFAYQNVKRFADGDFLRRNGRSKTKPVQESPPSSLPER